MKKLIGNENAAKIIDRLVRDGRLPGALLFAGPNGVGKRGFAKSLSADLLCRQPVDFKACGKCGSCLRVSAFDRPSSSSRDDFKTVFLSEHPDLGAVFPYNKNILVDAIRDLEKETNFEPFEAKHRIFIVDEAEKMNDAASNALLKTLEETPGSSHIILITSRPEALLTTILSRCQTIRFSPIERDVLINHLVAEKGFSDADAEFAADVSGGSLLAALNTNVGLIRTRRDEILKLIDAAIVGDRDVLLGAADEMNLAKNKDRIDEDIDLLYALAVDCWHLSLGYGKLSNVEIKERLGVVATKAPSKVFAGWMQRIDETRQSFMINANKKIALDALFMDMAAAV